MLSRPVIGRPVMNNVQEEFKKCVNIHLARNMLQCKIFEQVYTIFMNKEFQQLSVSQVENVFTEFGLKEYYSTKLLPIKSIQGTTVTGRDINNYTSKKDILYLLHFIVADQPTPRKITAKQLFFLLLFYLHLNDLLDRDVCWFMLEELHYFMELMRYGPQRNFQPTKKQQLVELFVRWALELAKLEDLLIVFGSND